MPINASLPHDSISNELEVMELNNRINKLNSLKHNIHWYSYPAETKMYYSSNSTDCVLLDIILRKYKWSDYVYDIRKHWRDWINNQISVNGESELIDDDYDESSCSNIKNTTYGFMIIMLLVLVPYALIQMAGSSFSKVASLFTIIITMIALTITAFFTLDDICEYIIFPNMINRKVIKKAIIKAKNAKFNLKSNGDFNDTRYIERFKKASLKDRNKYVEILSILDNSKNNIIPSITDREIKNLYNRSILSIYILLEYEKNYPEIMNIIDELCITYVKKFNNIFDIRFDIKNNTIFTHLKEAIINFTKIITDYITNYSEKCNAAAEEKISELNELLNKSE